MSRAYRIAVAHGVSRVVHLDDGVSAPLELLGILPAERMGKLLLDELERRGFDTSDPAKPFKELGDDVRIEVDVQKGEVSLKVEGLKEVVKEAEFETYGDTDYGRQFEEDKRAELQAHAEKELSAQAEQEEQQLRQAATKALEARLQDMREELDAIVTAVTGTALKERARSMGEVEELSESANGEMNIRVRL